MHTEFGWIAHLTKTAGKDASPLQHEIARLSRIDRTPFDTDRKRMSVLCASPTPDSPKGRVLYCKEAPQTVLGVCEFVKFDSGNKQKIPRRNQCPTLDCRELPGQNQCMNIRPNPDMSTCHGY